MAWTVKATAKTEIPTRDEPYLTEEMRNRHEAETLPRYERKRGALLPILHEMQDTYRHIPYQAMVEIAMLLEIKPSDVLDTVSFYEEFTTSPVGKHVISICQSVACEICGHPVLLDHLREKLGVEPHHTTENGKFTLLVLECLGGCDIAPCALINDDLIGNLTIEKLDEIIEGLPD